MQYPLSKEEYGNSLWKVIHSYTANMPERLSPDDKRKFRQTFLDLVDHFPCTDCKDHAHEYMKEHKPTGSTNRDVFNYVCNFHNHVNASTGKPLQDCNNLWNSSSKVPCPTCSTTAKPPSSEVSTPKPSPDNSENIKKVSTIDQIIDSNLKAHLGNYKDTSKKIVETMHINAGVKVPEMVFSEKTACTDPDRSCTHLIVDKDTGKLRHTVIHFNTNQYGPRTAVHESLHSIAKAKGLDALAVDENSITKGARTIISRDFPTDVYTNNLNTAQLEVRDESAHDSTTQQQPTKAGTAGSESSSPLSPTLTPVPTVSPPKWDPIKGYKERASKRLETVGDSFPYFSRYYHPAMKHKKEEPAPQVVPTVTYSDGRPVYPQVPTQQVQEKQEPTSATEGFTSMLNPIYAPFASALGLKPEDVNSAHTPALLANGMIVLAESNLNKFGSMALSLLAAATTLAAGTLAKDNIGFADKRLLVGLGGAFLWNAALRYLPNPKHYEECAGQAMEFGSSITSMDFEACMGSITSDVPKELDPEKAALKGKGGTSSGLQNDMRRNISSQVGGGTELVGRNKTYDVDTDIYEDPDSTIGWPNANQGTAKRQFRRTDPFFPST